MKNQKSNIKNLLICLIVLVFVNSIFAQNAERRIEKNILISDKLPKVKIVVDKKFKYVGSFAFKIRDVAAGERYVFVDAKNGKVKRMFIAQFEGFLPGVDDFYRYNFDNAQMFGSHKFRQNTFAYSNREARRENPAGEGVLTFDFLKQKGFSVEDELMLSRFLTVPDAEKKHELILFYIENVSESKHKLSEFYKDDEATEIWKNISKDLTQRSLKAFEIQN